MIQNVIQAYLLLNTIAGSFFVGGKTNRSRRIGYIIGITGQPAWLYTTISNQQWGMALVGCWCLFNYTRGYFNNRTPKDV